VYITEGNPGQYHNGGSTASPGMMGANDEDVNGLSGSGDGSAGALRQGTGHSVRLVAPDTNSSSEEGTLAGRPTGANTDPEKHHHHGGAIGEKIHNMRHRGAKNRGNTGLNFESTDPSLPPERNGSTGPRSFMQRVATGLTEPRPKIRKEPTYKASMLAIAKASWLNLLLVCIPVSWALHFAGVDEVVVFVFSFLAIIPLAKLLGFATEELSLRVGQTLGGLLNATLGNVVELIVAILALVKCELQLVQSSLLGSILSNLLLVLGMCFFAGGLRFSEQSFGDTGAQINSSLLVTSVIAILIPAGFHAAFSGNDPNEQADVLAMSRGTAVILLVIYLAYMMFQLWSHSHLFVDGSADQAPMQTRKLGKHTMFKEAKSVRKAQAAAGGGGNSLENGEAEEEEEEEVPSINLWSCIILLLVVGALVGVTAEWLVDSINGLTERGGITEQWVGLILLPIVGNAAEHVTAVTVAAKDKLDLSIGVAVGSSIQIALFVIPVLVLLAWALDKPLSLLFDPLESVILFLTVLLANYTMQDSRSNWLEGWLLMSVYLIIGTVVWFYPSQATAEALLLRCN